MLSWCGVDEEDLQSLHKKFGKSIFESTLGAKKDFAAQVPIKDGAKKLLKALSTRIPEWEAFINSGEHQFVVERARELLDAHTSDKRSKGVLSIVAEIFKKKSSGGLKQVNSDVRKQMSTPQKDEGPTTSVTLMTAHASKGLEFDMVWILGADSDTFPAKDSQIGSAMQEERRLFYVAMTRARKTLWISATTQEVSPFILEADVQRVGRAHFEDVHLAGSQN